MSDLQALLEVWGPLVLLVLLVLWALLAPRGRKVTPDRRVILALPAPRERPEQRATPVPRVRRVQLEDLDRLVLRAQQAHREQQEQQARREQQALKVRQALRERRERPGRPSLPMPSRSPARPIAPSA